jgi:glyoxylase-like metal-dependent hydrolase (beta-lactamase superfamily II)
MQPLSRRNLLTGSIAAAGGAAFRVSLPAPAAAAAPPADSQAPGYYRFKIGSFELTALYDGVWNWATDQGLVRGASRADVRQALTSAFLTATNIAMPITALLVNTGRLLVLIDAGTAGRVAATAGTLAQNMAAAGVDPKSIDMVLISHFHADHINGLHDDRGAPAFPNAEIAVPAREWDFWMDDGVLSQAPTPRKAAFYNARGIFGSPGKEIRRFESDRELAPGITPVAAYGHTPGHTAFAVASGNQSMLVSGDTTYLPALFARHPEWQTIFDVDGNMATETRKRLLAQAASDRMLLQGYHFPFPSVGHVQRDGDGYAVIPVAWSPTL